MPWAGIGFSSHHIVFPTLYYSFGHLGRLPHLKLIPRNSPLHQDSQAVIAITGLPSITLPGPSLVETQGCEARLEA